MGWNELSFCAGESSPDPTLRASLCSVAPNSLFENISSGDHMYFVHSYHCAMQHEKEVIATTDYGGAVTAAIARENIMGVQFHPEKSQQSGLQLFQNFLLMGHHASSR
jgi:imidazole glycerol phosphate synthase glutamine amidotransferase subunit